MSSVIRREREKFTIPGKYLLFILTTLSIVLAVITINTNIFSGVSNTIVGVIVVPFQKGATVAGTFLTHQAEKFTTMDKLREENHKLKKQVADLMEANTQLAQDQYEIQELRKLYSLDAKYSSYKKVGARVIAKDSGNWYHSFIINKGTEDGLAVNMNIIADGGLVGRISSIGKNWSKITTIIADNSAVSGKVLTTSDNLIVSGSLENYSKGVINFSKLKDDSDRVSVSDKIVTSNISDKYLPGILIGYITTIESDSNNLTKSGTVTPAVDFEHLDEVLVITTLKQTVNEDKEVLETDSIIPDTDKKKSSKNSNENSSEESSGSDEAENRQNN